VLRDVVIDTNVFVHATNRENFAFASSIALMEELRVVSTALCVDAPSLERARGDLGAIMNEYRSNLTFGMLGFAVLGHLASNERLRFIDTDVAQQDRRDVWTLLDGRVDRVFALVAIKSEERELVTHDDTDFDEVVCEALLTRWGVSVTNAAGALGLLK
jgi:hypothetical protein